jgi:MFS family permease
MVAGTLISSIVSGALITRTGKWKSWVVGGGFLLIIGFGLFSTIDYYTPIWHICVFMAIVGVAMGALMQNLVLAVQNTVSLENIGAASSSVAFFRTFGGAIGVSVLGSILATQVTDRSKELFPQIAAENGVPPEALQGMLQNPAATSPSVGADVPHWVATVPEIAFGEATGHIFLIAMFCAIVTFIATLFLPNKPLRRTLDMEPSGPAAPVAPAAEAAEIADGEQAGAGDEAGETLAAADASGTGKHEK